MARLPFVHVSLLAFVTLMSSTSLIAGEEYSPERWVSAVQVALEDAGYYSGDVNGVLDAETKAALLTLNEEDDRRLDELLRKVGEKFGPTIENIKWDGNSTTATWDRVEGTDHYEIRRSPVGGICYTCGNMMTTGNRVQIADRVSHYGVGKWNVSVRACKVFAEPEGNYIDWTASMCGPWSFVGSFFGPKP